MTNRPPLEDIQGRAVTEKRVGIYTYLKARTPVAAVE
jgi:hypothetical protein